MTCNLINSYEIETIYGRKSIEIYNGDITSFFKPYDILILSSYSYHYRSTKGTIIHALKEKNVDINKLSYNPYIDLRKKLHIWLSDELYNTQCKFKRTICIEFDKNYPTNESLNSLLPFLSLIENLNIPVNNIAMPLLGTGALNLPVESILKYQLKQCERCLNNVESLSKIYLVEKGEEKAARLDSALNKYLDRSEIQIKDIFMDNYNSEILEKLEYNICKLIKLKKTTNSDIDYEVLDDFLNQIKRKSLRYFELCSYARKIIEVLLEEQLENGSSGNLQRSIDSYLKQGTVSTWIVSYMHVIRVLTNNKIHYSNSTKKIPNDIKNQDQRILLSCLYQITDYWLEITLS